MKNAIGETVIMHVVESITAVAEDEDEDVADFLEEKYELDEREVTMLFKAGLF